MQNITNRFLKYLINPHLLKTKFSAKFQEFERSPFYSQKGQDEWLLMEAFNYQKNGLKREGFFVDLACADGVEINNTLFLEKHLSWKGILIEPNPYYKDSIKKNRTSDFVSTCVTSEANQTIKFRVDNGMLGGIVGDNFDNNESIRKAELKNAEIIEIETRTLTDILLEYKAPKLIDYLSLDIEGAEYEALRNFDFDYFKFVAMTIERPTLELDLLLDEAGYLQVRRHLFDTFYIHKDHIKSTSCKDTPYFMITPRKNW